MIKIGEKFNEKESGMPTLEILNDIDNKKYYIHPFMGYKFQVSGTAEGGGDYGSTEVVGLANIYDGLIGEGGSNSPARQSNVSGEHMIAEVYFCMAMTAIAKHARYLNTNIKMNYEADEKLRVFIKDCVEYISKYCK